MSLLVFREDCDALLEDLIAECAKWSCGMRIQAIKLQVQGDSVFLKRWIILYGLQEVVHKSLNELCAKSVIEPI